MKKKEKSGHRKRLESKKRALKECASAVGQKSIFSMFGKKDSAGAQLGILEGRGPGDKKGTIRNFV